MKKIVHILLVTLLFLFSTIISSYAVDDTPNVFAFGDKEIIILDESINYETMERIASYIAKDNPSTPKILDDPENPDNIICDIFGHNLTTTTAVEVTHNVYTTSPKCVRKTYNVEYCTRCDYINKTLKSSVRISTCHG